MKSIITLAILAISIFAHGQSQQTAPTKKSNAVIVKSDKSYDELYRLTGQAFLSAGLSIKISDKDIGMIESERKDLGNFPIYPTTIYATIQGGQVTFYAKVFDGNTGHNVTKGYKKTWATLIQMAHDVGEEVYYNEM